MYIQDTHKCGFIYKNMGDFFIHKGETKKEGNRGVCAPT